MKLSNIRTTAFCMLFSAFFGLNGFSQTKTAYMIADAHLDTQWDWDVQTTIDQYVKNTLVDNFTLFKKYPNYKFNFEGAIKYMWAKEYYPELYAELKKYVVSGQWNIAGSSLDATDIIVPSTESQIRNILIGQTFYKREFGKKSNDIFLPDCFGFGYTLPTIMNHCGLIGFCTQKLSWGGIITPFKIGAWQGVDGSKILAACSAGGYGQKFNEDLTRRNELIDWSNETGEKTKGKHFIAFRLYGTGDRGGAPEDRTVSWIEKSLVSDGPVTIKSATPADMYNQYYPLLNDFPLYNSELIMTTHGTGCYTSRTMLKLWNRKNELLADASERSSVIADWFGGLPYPASDLNEAWIRLIWHQFHDDLTGTSIPRAYTFTYNDHIVNQNKFSTILTNAVGAGVRSLNTQTEGSAIVVYNPLSISREDVVEANIKVKSKVPAIKVINSKGIEVPSQIISTNDTLLKLVFVASVKSLGYEVYDVRTASKPSAVTNNLQITKNSLENSVYKISIDANGDINSIIDKTNGNKQLLASPVRMALFKDSSTFWPSWEIQYKTVLAEPQAFVDGKPLISIEEQGPVRISLKITRVKDNSTYVQYVKLTNTDTKRRIDVVNDINWMSTKTLLKAEFSLSATNPEATYDLGIGVIKRPNNTSIRYEVPSQQWADITNVDNSYGVSILNDCKYGWDKPSDNTLRLSLIHTPEIKRNYVYQGTQDIGNNQFTYSIYGHANTCLEAGSTWEASKLNQPLVAFEAVKHSGMMGKSFSFLNIESSQVALKTLKKAENSNDYVLRFYETKGVNATNVKVKFAGKIIAAKELNGIEEEIGDANFSDSTLLISMNAFQPKTYSIHLSSPSFKITAPISKPLQLSYNLDAISSRNNMKDGDVDGKSNTYSSELMPDTIITDAIKFVVGPKSDGQMNALKCNGSKIVIPKGFTKIYILAASTDLNGTTDIFYVDKKPFKLKVDYFSDFIGQATAFNFVGGDTSITANYFKKVNIAFTGTHRHNGIANKMQSYVYTYIFKYCIDVPSGAKELILPKNNQLIIFAVTASNNQNDDTKASSEILTIQKADNFKSIIPMESRVSLCQGKLAKASGQTNSSESAAMAIDGNESTKWCQDSIGDKWIAIDLGKPTQIAEWWIKHAGMESVTYITADFKLQKLEGTEWVDVDVVSDNKLNTTDRKVTPFIAQHVRLYIAKSTRNKVVRINEFKLFGTN